jgi:hypothetical protein
MKIRSTSVLGSSILAASIFAASTAPARPLHVNDIHYIQAAACQGLITSPDLPPMDPTAINRFMDIESGGRTQIALDQADTARQKAKRDAATAGPEKRADLIAQRESASCRQYVSMGAHASAGRLSGEP